MRIFGSAINRGGRNTPKAMRMGSEVPNIVISRTTDRSGDYMTNKLAAKRNAGMMLDSVLTNASTASFGVSTFGDAYRNSYANGALRPSGASDVPIYFQMMNMQNGGILYYPVKLSEKYEWFRYWARSDAYIGRGLELLSDLPLSKISLNMPKMEGQKELRQEIHDFYLHMVDHLNLFDKLQSLLWEYNCLGNCFPADHLVRTINGLVPISEIREGDLVLTEQGNFKRVAQTTFRDIQEYIKDIKIDGMNVVNFTPTKEHPIFILRDGVNMMLEAKDLRVGDYVSMAYDKTINDIENIKIGSEEIKVDNSFMLYLGRWFRHPINRFKDNDNNLHESFLKEFTNNNGAICLPKWLMELPSHKQMAFLCGYSLKENTIYFEHNNVQHNSKFEDNVALALQISELAFRNGIPNSINYSYKAEKIIYVASDYAIDYKYIDGQFYYRICEIGKKFFKGRVYNFEVEDDHTYCVNGIKTHNCFLFHEWDEEKKMWDKIIFLPPEEVAIFQYPFSNDSWAEYFPQRIIKLVQTSVVSGHDNMSEMEEGIVQRIPDEIKKMILETGKIVLDTDPMSGSFLHHIARRKSPYQDLGSSVLDRVLVPMLHKEHMKYTQLSILTRNMTPTNLIYADNVGQDALDDLRAQVDLRMMDPDYNIVTNFPVTWEQIGAENRLLDLGREYETIENQIFAAMGVTRELLTGEGTYSGTRITIEILNTMFLLTREVLQNYVEKCLFKPVAEAHGWYIKDKNGAKKYLYPKVGFNRLTIRDNAEVFDSLFQLYQKGSLPIDVIYELLNLNTSDLHERIYEDLFTVKDPNFNRLTDGLLTEAGRSISTGTDIIDRVIKYLNLKKQEESPDGGMGGDMGGPPADEFDMSALMGEEAPPEAAAGATEGDGGAGFADEEGGQELPENGSGILAENLVVKAPQENVDKKDGNNDNPPITENLAVKGGSPEVRSENLAVKGEVKSNNLVVKSGNPVVKTDLPLPKNLAVKTKKAPLTRDLAVVIKQNDDIKAENLVVADKNGSMA